jgi:hypothetical protein
MENRRTLFAILVFLLLITIGEVDGYEREVLQTTVSSGR